MTHPNAQIVLQYPALGGGYVCHGLLGLPVPAPVQIAVVSAGTSESDAAARQLGLAVEDALQGLSTNRVDVPMPCGGHRSSPLHCWAQGAADTRKLLVLVGGAGGAPPPPHSWIDLVTHWATEPSGGRFLVVLPGNENPDDWLPAWLSRRNVFAWSQTVREAVPTVLVAAGIVPDDWRVFISYRRSEARDMADQLFDELTHRGFDVFLDRFRIPAGVDFEARLEDELRDKAMVVVIESPGILRSRWTVGELAFAFRNRLGVFAIHLPGGAYVPLVWSRRLNVQLAGARLTDASLQAAVERIQRAHEVAVTWRRRFVSGQVRRALLHEGVRADPARPDGIVRVSGGTAYRIGVSPYPPGLKEFHTTDLERGSDRAVLVGPAAFRERDRGARIRWLAEHAGIPVVDESQLTDMARQIRAGIL